MRRAPCHAHRRVAASPRRCFAAFCRRLGGRVSPSRADVAALGAYRALYLVNWVFSYFTEEDYLQRIVWFAGVVQTGLYCDFFYHYYQSKRGGMNRPVKLPV